MDKKSLLIINLFFLFMLFFLGHGASNDDSWPTITGLVLILTLVNLYNIIFDQFGENATKRLTFFITILSLIQLFLIVIHY